MPLSSLHRLLHRDASSSSTMLSMRKCHNHLPGFYPLYRYTKK
ncbi:hypothetical protein HMPREF9081_2450 [Centipeda periodontii DSM 2778]|uniref:Uncharacterized protein n=1 Tax=Centipeda periodontii DSM 2778 TaxID=888060 RepID=F5RQB4_9FIRM|nr:hypothetical protein HMPREF9081_2450 [Centipeda periodontii DSM 2778]